MGLSMEGMRCVRSRPISSRPGQARPAPAMTTGTSAATYDRDSPATTMGRRPDDIVHCGSCQIIQSTSNCSNGSISGGPRRLDGPMSAALLHECRRRQNAGCELMRKTHVRITPWRRIAFDSNFVEAAAKTLPLAGKFLLGFALTMGTCAHLGRPQHEHVGSPQRLDATCSQPVRCAGR